MLAFINSFRNFGFVLLNFWFVSQNSNRHYDSFCYESKIKCQLQRLCYKLSAAGQIVDWQFPRKIQHWKTNFKTNGQWLRESEFNWKFVRWGIYKNKCKLTQKVAGRKLLKKKAARCAFFVIDAKEWPHQGLLDGHESKLFLFLLQVNKQWR